MITISSNNINIIDAGIINGAHVIEMTPLVLPYPASQWYSQTGNGYFYDMVWDDASNNYVVIQKQIRTQLELH